MSGNNKQPGGQPAPFFALYDEGDEIRLVVNAHGPEQTNIARDLLAAVVALRSVRRDPAQTTLPTEADDEEPLFNRRSYAVDEPTEADDEVTEPETTPERRIFVREHTVPAFYRKSPRRRSNE